MKVLILATSGSCPFTDIVQSRLIKDNVEVVRLSLINLFDVDSPYFVPFKLNQSSFTFEYKSKSYSLESFDVIWKRRFDGNFYNNVIKVGRYKTFPSSIIGYLEREVKAFAEGILGLARLKKIRIINDYNYQIRDKLNQIQEAKKNGLSVPDFLFTNQKASIVNLVEKYENLITKPCSNFGYIRDEESVYSTKTNGVESKEIQNLPDRVFPSFFQNAIDKIYELKCIYVGGELYGVKQTIVKENNLNFVDIKFEYSNDNVELEGYSVNKEIKRKVKKLCDFYNIDVCTMDFLVDDNNNYTFLEINQDGLISYYANFLRDDIYNKLYSLIVNEKI